jgi:acetyl-CoA carboxylase carboxyl transferase subunit beta
MSGRAGKGVASAWERAALVVDEGSVEVWDDDVVSGDPLAFADVRPYRERLEEAAERTGMRESVLTGRATVAGRPVALVAAEFGFLGGSIGVATGERIARAFERALEERLPLVALPASGGSRMQEGTLALVQMAKLAAAARALRDGGLPYVVCLTDPTTGGVLASWGSLGTVTFALPDARLGFAGPRVVELLTGAPLPDGVQTAESLLAHGHLDAVVPPHELRRAVASVLAVTPPGRDLCHSAVAHRQLDDKGPARAAGGARNAWESLRFARDRARPGVSELLAAHATDVTELRGDRAGHPDDPGCLLALARFAGRSVVVVGQRRRADGSPPALGPAGYRKARRGMALAAELRLPLVTVVDTPGAELSAAAEHGGVAGEIARCLAEMAALPVPTVALLVGEGGSGGALALLVADRVVCVEHASLGVIAPEGASAILYRDLDHAPELAATQGGASWQLAEAGIADAVVPEPVPAHEQPAAFLDRLAAVAAEQLDALAVQEAPDRLAARHARWRALGAPSR